MAEVSAEAAVGAERSAAFDNVRERSGLRSSGPVHRIAQIHHGLLAHAQRPFLRGVEILDEPDHEREDQRNRDDRERAVRSRGPLWYPIVPKAKNAIA